LYSQREGRSLKKIAFVVIMLLAVFLSTTIEVNSAAGASIDISPDRLTVPVNTSFVLNLTVDNVADMYAWTVTLVYPQIITMTGVNTINDTAFTDGSGFAFFTQSVYNSTYYQVYVARTLLSPNTAGVTGSGLVAQLVFEAISIGTAPISCTYSEMVNSQDIDITPVNVATVLAIITVAAAPVAPPSTVGGWSFSVAKTVFPTPYIGLALAMIAAFATIATTIYFKGIKPRKEKQ
jgi:hypothetical protein